MNKALLGISALGLLITGVALVWVANQWRQPIIEVGSLPTTPTTDSRPMPRSKQSLPEGWMKEFALTERSGKEFKTENMYGKVWGASFFFADCPGECRQQNLAIAQIAKEFGPQGVTFVSITCDPERDTPERLREYAHTYTKSADEWLFLTGDLKYIQKVGAEFFRVPIDKGTHGSRLILVDKWGNPRGYYSTNGARSPEEYAQIRPMLKKLLAETEEPAEFKTEGAQGDGLHREATPLSKEKKQEDSSSNGASKKTDDAQTTNEASN